MLYLKDKLKNSLCIDDLDENIINSKYILSLDGRPDGEKHYGVIGIFNTLEEALLEAGRDQSGNPTHILTPGGELFENYPPEWDYPVRKNFFHLKLDKITARQKWFLNKAKDGPGPANMLNSLKLHALPAENVIYMGKNSGMTKKRAMAFLLDLIEEDLIEMVNCDPCQGVTDSRFDQLGRGKKDYRIKRKSLRWE